jgi:hypothetical protein
MIRPLLCLLPILFAASCADPKAVVVEETPASKPKPAQAKPTGPEGEATPDTPMPRTVQQSGMRVPDLTERLPERKDMTPTAAPTTGGGPTVIATPPSGE